MTITRTNDTLTATKKGMTQTIAWVQPNGIVSDSIERACAGFNGFISTHATKKDVRMMEKAVSALIAESA